MAVNEFKLHIASIYRFSHLYVTRSIAKGKNACTSFKYYDFVIKHEIISYLPII